MKSILKYINSIPFSFTIKHYQIFGESTPMLKNNSLNHMESWDALRQDHPHFSIPDTREKWLEAVGLKVVKDGQDKNMLERAKYITKILAGENITSIFSVGVGGAGLEYQIKKNIPSIKLACSEYSTKNVDMLRKVFTECDDFVTFDILNGDWNDIKKKYLNDASSLLLMYRLDAGFTDEEWRIIFEKINDAGIENVMYITTTFLTILSLWNRKKREVKWFLSKTPVSFAGHIRTKVRFQNFWKNLYTGKFSDYVGLPGFFLKKIKK